jgi:rare lipoprotein A
MIISKLAGYLAKGVSYAAVPALCLALTSCGTTANVEKPKKRSKEYFPESVYGVKASPRVADGKNIPKGGGRFQVGKPYKVKDKWYTPKEDYAYNKVGVSSWYGSAFHGRLTANGEVYDSAHLSAAHPTFPLPSYARVTNVENGSSVIVRVNDRGPYEYGRIIDVSSKTADLLDIKRKGSAQVRVQYVGRAPLEGNDMPYLMASYAPKGSRVPGIAPEGQIASGVMVASNEPLSRQMRSLSSSADSRSARSPVPTSARMAQPGISARSLDVGAPVTAMAEPEHVLRAPDAFRALEEFAMLPEIGPIPVERPGTFNRSGNGSLYAAAYVEARVSTSEKAFEAIMVDPDALTSAAIQAHARRSQP